MFQIRVLVNKLLCLDCQERHGKPDATFGRGPDASIYDPRSLVRPRCGGKCLAAPVSGSATEIP